MSDITLKLALIDGPAYAPLYRSLEAFSRETGIEVQAAYRGTHPDLNRRVKAALESGSSEFDLISTHTKYAPSQAFGLLPLDDFFRQEELAAFSPSLLELARFRGNLMCMPRNFDARLLFYRTDRFESLGLSAPRTWTELGAAAARCRDAGWTGFVYPGKESGLFGTFFELLVSEDGTLFDETLRPTFHGNEGVRALSILKKWYQDGLTPSALPEMHFDEVSANFRDGDSSMVTDWPGYYGLLQHSSVSGRYGAALTPASDAGKRAVYGGSHAFAIPAAARHPEASARLLKYLTSEEVQAIDAGSGHVPVRPGLLSKLKDEAGAGTLEAQRWALLEETIATSVVIPPKFATYPEAEDRLWQALRQCILGKWDEQTALRTAATDMIRIISEG